MTFSLVRGAILWGCLTVETCVIVLALTMFPLGPQTYTTVMSALAGLAICSVALLRR